MGCAEDMSLPGEDLAGRSGEKLVHDGKIIAFSRRKCIKESLLRFLVNAA